MSARGALGDVLAHQADRVLAGAALPWAVGIGKVNFAFQSRRNGSIASELRAVVEGDRMRGEPTQCRDRCVGDLLRQSPASAWPQQAHVPTLALDQAQPS